MRYQFLLIDNDNTLMDFTAAEHAAIRETFRQAGLPSDDSTVSLYSEINDALWKALERGEVTQRFLKVERFRRLLTRIGDPGDPQALAALYETRLGCHAELMDGAMSFMEAVYGKAKIALVSNGVSAIQRSRLSRCPFTPLLDSVVISEEVGFSKPDPRIINAALEGLGCEDKRLAVMIGDSLTADIACAKNAGIDAIWLNPAGDAASLSEVLALIQ